MKRSADQALARAYAEIRHSKPNAAEAVLRPLTLASCDDPRPHALLAMVHDIRGHPGAATLELRRSLLIKPNMATGWINLASASGSSPVKRVRALCQRSFMVDPANRAVYLGWLRDPRLPERRWIALRALLLDPSNSLALTVVANDLADGLDPTRAPVLARRASRSSPLSPGAWFAVARAGDPDKNASRRAVLLAPGAATGLGEHGTLLLRIGEPDRASIWLGPRLSILGPGPDQRLRAAFRLLYAETGSAAARHFEALSAGTDDPRRQVVMTAMVAWAGGDPDEADRILGQLIEDPDLDVGPRPRDSSGDMLRVGREFHRLLDTLGPAAPATSTDRLSDGRTGDGGTVFWSCDEVYFRRYAPILFADAQRHSTTRFQLHLLGPVNRGLAAEFGQRAGIAIDIEPIPDEFSDGAARLAFCSSIRLARAWALLEAGACRRIAIADVDARLVGDPQELLALLDHAPVALIDMGATGAPPWMRFPAGLTLFSGEDAGRRVLDHAARHVGHFLSGGRARWRLDQCALFAAIRHEQPALADTGLDIRRRVRFLTSGEETAWIARVLTTLTPPDRALLDHISQASIE